MVLVYSLWGSLMGSGMVFVLPPLPFWRCNLHRRLRCFYIHDLLNFDYDRRTCGPGSRMANLSDLSSARPPLLADAQVAKAHAPRSNEEFIVYERSDTTSQVEFSRLSSVHPVLCACGGYQWTRVYSATLCSVSQVAPCSNY